MKTHPQTAAAARDSSRFNLRPPKRLQPNPYALDPGGLKCPEVRAPVVAAFSSRTGAPGAVRHSSWIRRCSFFTRPSRLHLFLALLLALAGGFTLARAQVTATVVGHLGGVMTAVAVPQDGGPYIYAGEGDRLAAWDVSDKANPVQVGGVSFQYTHATDIAFSGTMACVANAVGLQVMSLVDPTHPRLLGSLLTTGTADCVAMVEPVAGTVYALLGTSGSQAYRRIRVINLADPASPIEAGGASVAGYPKGICVVGNRVYVAAAAAGLLVFDIDATGALQNLGAYDTPGYASQVQVSGTVAYVTDGAGGLQVLDVSDPANIAPLAKAETGGRLEQVQLAGTIAYALDTTADELWVLDVATPTAPVRICTLSPGWGPSRLAVGDNHVYLACNEGLLIVNVSDPSNPTPASRFEQPSLVLGGASAGDYTYLIDMSQLWVYRTTTPAAPALQGKCDLDSASTASRISVAGSFAVVAQGRSGMPIVDISDPTNPTLVGRFAIPAGAFASDVALSGTTACLLTVAGGQGRLRIVSITDPAAPLELGGLDTPGDARRVAVLDNIACMADGPAGVRIINIGIPNAPFEVGHIDPPTGGAADSVAADRHPTSGQPQLFVVFNSATVAHVRSYNVTDPAAPVLLAEYQAANEHIWDMAVQQDYVYAAGSLHVLNRDNMTAALRVPEWYMASLVVLQVVHSRMLLAIQEDYGASIFQVNNSPDQLAQMQVVPSEVGLQVGGTQQFAATGYDAQGNQVPITPTWTTTGGTITQGGLYTATATGDFTVIASVAGSPVTGVATVHVTPGQLAQMQVVPSEVGLQVGGTQQFAAAGYDAQGNQVPITPTWTTTGGTITQGGLYTATETGDYTVIASVEGSVVTGTATVHCVFGVRIDPLQSKPGFRLLWPSKPGCVYDVYQSSSLMPGTWVRVATGLPATPPENEWRDTSPTMPFEESFYHLVERTP